MGGPEQLQVQRFCEAAYDQSTGLTYSALIGLKSSPLVMLSASLIPMSRSSWCRKGIHMRHTIFALYETGAEQQMNEAQVSTVTS